MRSSTLCLALLFVLSCAVSVVPASAQLCSPGFASPSGSAPCTACPAGRYQPAFGQTSCLTCSPGTFSLPGSALCSTCPAGTFSGAGSGSCSTCPGGTFSLPGSAFCTQCPAGSYSSPGSATCSNCPPGTIAPSPGSSSCQPCPPGFGPNATRTACEPLPTPGNPATWGRVKTIYR